jgi:hypothetical protein
MKFKLTNDFPTITGLQGNIIADYARLVEVFGEPNSDGDEYKVQKEWVIMFADGTFATIYDWKEGDAYNGEGQGKHYTKVTDWHIGGESRRAVELVTMTVEAFGSEEDVQDDDEDIEPLYTVEQIAKVAEQACFYVTPEGLWLRMQYTDLDEGYFMAMDEDSGEDYRIEFADLVYDEVHFEELTKMTI